MKIKTKKFIKQLLIFELVYSIIMNFLCYFLKLPVILKYIIDILNIIILFYDISNIKVILSNKNLKHINRLIFFSIFFIIIGFTVNNYSVWNFVWGIRTIIRFIGVFYAVILTFDNKDRTNLFKILGRLFFINVVVCLFEFFVFGWKQDLLGGTFSDGGAGGNAGLLALIVFECIYITELYLNKKINLTKFLIITLLSFILAALAELKIFYVLYIVFLILSLFQNKISYKTIFMVSGGIMIFLFGINLLTIFFPLWDDWFSIEEISKTIYTNYSLTSQGLSRGSALQTIYAMFFENSFIKQLFGFGLGHCIKSSIPLFNSIFYNDYFYLNYNWFSHSFVYIETGAIGLVLFYLFFIFCLKCCNNNLKREKDFSIEKRTNIKVIRLFIIFALITSFYNSFLLIDSSYFVYILLAYPFIKEDN